MTNNKSKDVKLICDGCGKVYTQNQYSYLSDYLEKGKDRKFYCPECFEKNKIELDIPKNI